MRIFFDHQIFSYQTYGGISRYFYELMREFERSNVDFTLGLDYSINEYLNSSSFLSLKKSWISNDNPHLLKKALLCSINQNRSKRYLKELNYDLFHPTFYDPYFLSFLKSKPLVVTLHDMIPELFASNYLKKSIYNKLVTSRWVKAKKEMAKKADQLIAVSENTKKDAVELYGLDPHKIKVVHLGSSLNKNTINPVFKKSLPDHYLLFVGNRTSYKNFIPFVNAVAKLLKNDPILKIVCIGGGPFNGAEKATFSKANIGNRLLQFDVTEDNLPIAYKNARAFVFPSLYEGFGIPILEAFSCDCPVILSNSGSFPEVARDAAAYFDPGDMLSIAKTVETIIYDNNLRVNFIEKGRERVKIFTWKKTATETYKVYEAALSRTR